MIEFAKTIHDQRSAEQFIEWCVREIGAGFHPDTLFSDYVNVATGMAVFSEDDASRLELLLDRAFEFCDPYETALRAARGSLDLQDDFEISIL